MSESIFDNLYNCVNQNNAEELWIAEIKSYVENGGDVNVLDINTGWGLLHYASENLFAKVVEYVFKSGVNLDHVDQNGWNALVVALDASVDLAIQNNESKVDFEVVELLIRLGIKKDSYTAIASQILCNVSDKNSIEYAKLLALHEQGVD